MTKYLGYLSLILLPFVGFAQEHNDAKSFQKALSLSNEQHKPLLLIVGIKFPVNVNANVRIAANFPNDEDVLKKVKANFIVFETNMDDTAAKEIVSKLKLHNYPSFIFMHGNKDVFHTAFGVNSNKNRYLLMLERAIVLGKEKSLTTLESEYLANKTDNDFVKALIEARKKNGLIDNSKLIEQYANNLKVKDFNDYETVLFILQAGPYADGVAYKLAYSNRKVIDSIFRTESLTVRTAINNTIISNTMANAIRTRNAQQAFTAANLARNSNGKNYDAGNKSYQTNVLKYYKAVKDTANFIRNAIYFYDSSYMNISADSIKRMEAKQKLAAFEKNKPILPFESKTKLTQSQIDSIKANPNTVVRRETMSVLTAVSVSYGYANALNSIAWDFYQTGTKNINHLLKAVTWSTRAIELDPKSSYYDTLAHLFYQLGYFEQAIKTQQTAINQAKIEGTPYENMQEELRKFRLKK
jgi:tetratricopeptide (TPR) repeat protein